jgi:hypothetical protein
MQFGLNPSFGTWTSRLPLFRNLLHRAKRFEVFDRGGTQLTGESSPLGPDGWPVEDGRWHGVRVFGDMVPTTYPQPHELEVTGAVEPIIRSGGQGLVTVAWKKREQALIAGHGSVEIVWRGRGGGTHWFDGLTMATLRKFRPVAFRTLDWSLVNKRKPGDWASDIPAEDAPLHGTDLGVAPEIQARAARWLRAHLWFNVPPRYELSPEDYHTQLVRLLSRIEAIPGKPPILEMGNELWNDRISPAHKWLEGLAADRSWEFAAAKEIAILKRAADEVFGASTAFHHGYFLFVGGFIQNPVSMAEMLEDLRALGVTPDMAGPACYVGPLRSDRLLWEKNGTEPGIDALHRSCLARGEEVLRKLRAFKAQLAAANVRWLACYEAGQSGIAGTHPWRKAWGQYQRTEEMGMLYRRMREIMQSGGVDLGCWYSAATSQNPPMPTDPWGMLEGLGVPEMPKAKAAKGEL